MFKLMRNANIFRGFSNLQQTPKRAFAEQRTYQEKGINKVKLLGRVGHEPKQRGNEAFPAVSFSVATHSSQSSSAMDTFTERVDWHQVLVFDANLSEYVMEYATKGQRVMIIGRLMYNKTKDADGRYVMFTNIVADEVIVKE